MLNTTNPVDLSDLTSEASVATVDDAEARRQARLMAALKAQYRADQQEKFLHLQAETDSLLEQLRAMQQQKTAQPDPVLV